MCVRDSWLEGLVSEAFYDRIRDFVYMCMNLCMHVCMYVCVCLEETIVEVRCTIQILERTSKTYCRSLIESCRMVLY